MYLNHSKQTYIFDIETDGLDATVIWCLCAINVATGKEYTFTDYDSMRKFINAVLSRPDGVLVGHNAISFDAPVCNRLLGTRIPVSRLVDTFVLSMLYSPAMQGGHSLDAWGQRLKFPKTEFNDWSKLSDDMVKYCLNDCRVNVRVLAALCSRMLGVGFSERSCEIEHKAWANIQKQRRNGFQLDVPKAHELYTELRQLEKELKDDIYKQWPPSLEHVKTYAKARRNDGTPSAAFTRHTEQYPKVVELDDGRYEAYDLVEFNLGSPKQRVEKLLELGWKPREFTKPKSGAAGSPQATRKGQLVPSLEEFLEKNDVPEVRLLAEWIAINARANMVSNWIDLADEKGLIHGNLWLAGTLRYRHDKPNTANIPAVRVSEAGPLLGRSGQYTYEARDLWTVRDVGNRSLVGVDAKGIQLRILAHYLNNEKFTQNILSADPHEANRQSFNLPSRSLAKTTTYSILMGAGDGQTAKTAGISLKEAQAVKALFFEQVPELPKLIRKLKSELKATGRITLCSGARIMVPSDHMVIPYLLQGDESQIMKQAWIYVDEDIRRERIDAIKVGDIHDEGQFDVLERDVERFIKLCSLAFPRAGRSFDYNIPIEGDAKVGKTWACTH